ncbi:ribonuclease Z [bacterium]|nr:ribonuclease Z [candidate division CSSED10-310 bacterium]
MADHRARISLFTRLTADYTGGMTAFFHHRLLNDALHDPVLEVRLHRRNRILLFDAGTLTRLTPRNLLHVTDLFISHTHMDHFMDFDRLLRADLMSDKCIRVYGPAGFLAQCTAKLHAYTWNVCENFLFGMEIHEVLPGLVRSRRLDAARGFAPVQEVRERSVPGAGTGMVILEEPEFKVKALIHDHGVPCLAFRIEQPQRLGVDAAALQRHGFATGEWLEELRRLILAGAPGDTSVPVVGPGGVSHRRLDALRDFVLDLGNGRSLGYCVDSSPSDDNLARLTEFFNGIDVMYCEAAFAHADLDHARWKHHLTATQAGELARRTGAKKCIPCHISPRYEDAPERIIEETRAAFNGVS